MLLYSCNNYTMWSCWK